MAQDLLNGLMKRVRNGLNDVPKEALKSFDVFWERIGTTVMGELSRCTPSDLSNLKSVLPFDPENPLDARIEEDIEQSELLHVMAVRFAFELHRVLQLEMRGNGRTTDEMTPLQMSVGAMHSRPSRRLTLFVASFFGLIIWLLLTHR